MKTTRLALVTVIATLTAGTAAAFDIFLPPAGEDFLPSTKAKITASIGATTMTLDCSGPSRVTRGAPHGTPPLIDTEMMQLDLSCSNGVMVHLSTDPAKRSQGQTQSSGESFFDVFVDVTIPGLPVLSNCPAPTSARNAVVAPVHMQATIGHVPPLHAVYFSRAPVDLCDELEQRVGQLVEVQHDVNSVPKPESSGEVSQVFSCFYECKKDPQSTDWLEITTLMLVNQTVDIPLKADVCFIDGRQNPIARARIPLSPIDLDELNVCATLEGGLGQAAVPPAGLIEVVLTPTGGGYGWIKNLLGRFKHDNAEPFAAGQVVKGIGKTECRLVGPNVATAFKAYAKCSDVRVIPRILIEGTGGDAQPTGE